MKTLKKILLLSILSFAVMFYSCKEDIVSETIITGRVFHSETNEGYEGIAVSYRDGTGSIGGVSPFPVLLTYTDSLGNYEAHLPIDEEKNYDLIYEDTASDGYPCRYFEGKIEKEVNKTVTSQRIDVAVKYLSRCESFD